MEETEKIYLATKAIAKGWGFEELRYCDDLYGRENYADGVWEYVIECQEIGTIQFKEKYKEHKLYF